MRSLVQLAAILALAGPSGAAPAQVIRDIPVVEAMADYVAPTGLIALANGRVIHLRCLGHGTPTVIFTAGLGGWSATWAKVQPNIAKMTQACAWDRAGFGLSGADAATAQTVGRTTDDLEGALRGAGVTGPYILVGHSAGAHEVLIFADRHPRDVVGIVLVDPVRPHDVAREAVAGPKAARADRAYLAGEARRLRECAAGVERGAIKPGTPLAPCFVYFPEIPSSAQAVLVRLDADPARLRTQASAFEEYERNGERVVRNDRNYGDVPLIVVSAEKPGLWADEAKDEYPALQADWTESHKQLAALSRRGERRVAVGSGHLVQLDSPGAVVDAVRDVIAKASR